MEWRTFLDGVNDPDKKLAKDALKTLISSSLLDGDELVVSQARRLEKYMNELAQGKIDKEEFEGLVRDFTDERTVEVDGLDIALAAKLQRLKEGVQEMILGDLVKLL